MENQVNASITDAISEVVETAYTDIDLGHKVVQIRKWKAKDRKLFRQLVVENPENIDKKIIDVLVKSCVKDLSTNPIDLSYDELQYLFIKIREISISDEFEFTYTCKSCSKENITKNKINDIISFTWSPWVNIGGFEIQPIQNAAIYNKKITTKEYDENMELAFHIKTIDGKMMSFDKVIEYIEDMEVGKLDEVMKEFNKMRFSVVNKKTFNCSCGVERTFIFDQIPGFFPDTWLKRG